MLASYALQVFFHTLIISWCCVLGDSCSYVSRAIQILELGVMSCVQVFPTHMLSLEFVLGFCHGIVKGGDCKVEFNQPFYWLYSVPNLLVFQHLETLYLGGNHVRVVCERV